MKERAAKGQCGFKSGRGWADQVFALKKELYVAFMNL